MVGFGIIGVGTAGGWYADIVKELPDANLVAALRSPGGDTAAVEQRWSVPCLDDLAAFLALPDLDAVCIATPSGQHYAQAKAALEAGKHVLIEKPVTLKLAHADELIALAKARNLRLGVTFQRRADPLFQAIKAAVDSEAFGRPVLLSIVMPYYRSQAYYDSAFWRGTPELDGGGVLMNQGIHLVDLALWLFGEVKRVTTFDGTLARDIDVEDTVSVGLEYASGALGSICGTTASAPGAAHSLEVCGTKGSFRIEGERVVRWDVPGIAAPEATVRADGGASDPTKTSAANHRRVVQDLMGAIEAGRDPLVTAAEGKRSVAVVLAAYRAARTGSAVTLANNTQA